MKFSDIIDLAKAGYKPSDIKELLQLQEPEGSEGKNKEPEGSEGKKEPEGSEGKSKEEKWKKDPAFNPGINLDYKELYEKEKKLREELQNKNSKAPIDPEPLKIDEVIKSVKKSIS